MGTCDASLEKEEYGCVDNDRAQLRDEDPKIMKVESFALMGSVDPTLWYDSAVLWYQREIRTHAPAGTKKSWLLMIGPIAVKVKQKIHSMVTAAMKYPIGIVFWPIRLMTVLFDHFSSSFETQNAVSCYL